MIELTGITWDHPRGYAPLLANDSAAGVRVRWERRSLKDFGDATLADLAARFDLVVLDHPHMGQAASGILLPLDEMLSPDILRGIASPDCGPSFESYRYAGRLWALPIDAACQIASFRPDLLDASRVPCTWEEVMALGEELRAQDQWMAMALCPTDSLCSFLTLCAQEGDAPREDQWIRNETALTVLARLRAIRDVSHPDSLRWNPIAVYEQMADGAPIAYCPLAFGYTNYSRDGSRKVLRFVNPPGEAGALLGGAGIGVSARCSQPQAAAAYAAWLCGAEVQRGAYVRDGGQPAHGAAWTDPGADALCGAFFSGTRQAICNAYVRPRLPAWPKFQETVGETVHAHLSGLLTAEEAVARLSALHHQAFPSR